MDSVVAVLRALNLTLDEIAHRSRLPPERVQRLLEGAPPSAGDLRALSQGLKLPLRTLATGLPMSAVAATGGLKFRSPPAKALPTYEPTHEVISSFVEAAVKVLPHREAPPRWLDAFRPGVESFASADRMASAFRAALYPDDLIGPAVDLAERANSLDGLLINQIRHSKYEGASLLYRGYVFVFVSPRFAGRMLFTLAHELGHALAHHSEAEARLETASEIGHGHSAAERFVDAFASSFLLPAQGVARFLSVLRGSLGVERDEIGDIEIQYLARFYGVSFEVAARRCESLDLLPRGGAVSLTQHVNKSHGNAERRAQQLGLPERPKITIPLISPQIQLALFNAIDDGRVSLSWASEWFSTSVESLYSLHAEMNDAGYHRS